MKTFLIALPVVAMTLTACETPEQNAVAAGATGAIVGAALSSKSDRTTGALAGAAVGVAASTFIGRGAPGGQCYYRNAAGQRYVAAC